MNFMFKERLKGFCDKYLIKVLSDVKRHPVFRKEQYFLEPTDCKIITTASVCETEPLITLDIPLSRLNALADIEATFFNNIHEVGHRRTFEAWMDQQVEERRLQNKYPGVKEAFEHYSIMLNLCREQPKTFKELRENNTDLPE
jgi:hypothetical protein